MAQCQGPRAHIRFAFGLHLYLAGRYCVNPKVLGAQHSVNSARAKTWLVGVTIYCTFFIYNWSPPRQFLCNKILLKKISYSKGNAHWTNFWIETAWAPWPYITLITGRFHHKTIISMENFRLDCYLLSNIAKDNILYFPLPGPNHLQNLTPKCKILNVLWTYCK